MCLRGRRCLRTSGRFRGRCRRRCRRRCRLATLRRRACRRRSPRRPAQTGGHGFDRATTVPRRGPAPAPALRRLTPRTPAPRPRRGAPPARSPSHTPPTGNRVRSVTTHPARSPVRPAPVRSSPPHRPSPSRPRIPRPHPAPCPPPHRRVGERGCRGGTRSRRCRRSYCRTRTDGYRPPARPRRSAGRYAPPWRAGPRGGRRGGCGRPHADAAGCARTRRPPGRPRACRRRG